jgi:hypothetical protein
MRMSGDDLDTYRREMAEETLAAEIAAAQHVARLAAGAPLQPRQTPSKPRRKPSPVPPGWEGRELDWHELNDDPEAWEDAL